MLQPMPCSTILITALLLHGKARKARMHAAPLEHAQRLEIRAGGRDEKIPPLKIRDGYRLAHVLLRRKDGVEGVIQQRDKIQRRREAAAQQADINFPVDEPLLDIHAAAVADGKLHVRMELAGSASCCAAGCRG